MPIPYYCLSNFVHTARFFMPIKSYLAHPHKGKKAELIRAISNIAQCEVIPAKNRDILIVVTDTENKTADDELRERLESIKTLQLLVMISGFDIPKK